MRFSIGQTVRCIWAGMIRLLYARPFFILAVTLCLGVAGLVWYIFHLQTTLIQASALDSVAHYSQALQALRTLYTSEVVEIVRPQGIEVTHDYQAHAGAIPLPVTLTRLLGDRIAAANRGGQFLLYSAYPFPWRQQSGGLRDAFARQAWHHLTQHPEEAFYRFETYDGRPSLRYATADRMRPTCVRCHNTHPETPRNDWQEGDVRGVLEVILPLEYAMSQARSSFQGFSLLIATMTLAGLCCFGLVLRTLRNASQTARAHAKETQQANEELQREVAERQRVEEALRASEIRFRSVVQSANDAIVLADSSGTIVSWNTGAYTTFGYTEPEVLGQPLTLLMPARYQEAHCQGLERLQRTGETRVIGKTIALHGVRKDGSEFPLELSLSTWRTDHGVFFSGIIRDTTEHKRVEAALQRAQQAAEKARREAEYASLAKSQFLANVSHELRTPLNALLGYTQILRNDRNLSAKQHEGLEIMQQSGEHLLTLINDILDLAKIEAGRMELELTDFALAEMLTSLAGLFRVRAEDRGLTFVYAELTALPTWVRGDEKKLRQVLMNLLGNAVKFTEAGTVALHVGYHADKLRFQVEDTGMGIAATHLQDIFEAFHQLNPPNRMTEGTGLGLAISRTLTALMGGVLQVESQEGKGSRFWFELDLPAVEVPARTAYAEQRRVIGFTGDPVKILVVEDKWENRSVLAHMLAPLGFEVVEAIDGQDGVHKAMALQPAVIFMDLKMPVMDGIEAIRRIRELPFGHEVVIIAISASAFAYNRQDSLEAGSDDFLAKPFRLQTLLDLLEKHLHLEWIYAPETESPAATQDHEHDDAVSANASVHTAFHLPPEEEIGVLLDFARRGNIAAIRERVHALEQRNAHYTPFVAQVRQLAQGFQINAMEAFLARLLQRREAGEQR